MFSDQTWWKRRHILSLFRRHSVPSRCFDDTMLLTLLIYSYCRLLKLCPHACDPSSVVYQQGLKFPFLIFSFLNSCGFWSIKPPKNSGNKAAFRESSWELMSLNESFETRDQRTNSPFSVNYGAAQSSTRSRRKLHHNGAKKRRLWVFFNVFGDESDSDVLDFDVLGPKHKFQSPEFISVTSLNIWEVLLNSITEWFLIFWSLTFLTSCCQMLATDQLANTKSRTSS